MSIAGDAAYTENAIPKALNPTLALTDLDSTTLASATVTIGTGKAAGDVLALTNVSATMGNILGTYDAGTGVLTLGPADSSATLAQWQAALKAVTFASTSDNPGATRTLSWQVKDAQNNASNVGTTSMAVTAVNDAPVGPPSWPTKLPTPTPGLLTLMATAATSSPTPKAKRSRTAPSWPMEIQLPSWLSFDASTHTFSGNPPAGVPYLDIKVIGTDPSGGKASPPSS